MRAFAFSIARCPIWTEAKEAFKQIIAGGHRAAAVIESIRTIFKKEDRKQSSARPQRASSGKHSPWSERIWRNTG